jgi:multidrug efflux pump subunit AcrB
MFATTAIVKAVMSHARSVAQGNLSGSRDLAWKFEVRISGPALASGDNLRSLAAKGATIIEQNRLTDAVQTNWYQRVIKFEPEFYDARARWAGITREEVVRKQALEDRRIGLFYEEDETLPIVLRIKPDEGVAGDIAALRGVQIRPENSALIVPIDQVIDGISIKWEDPIVWRRDRKRTIS